MVVKYFKKLKTYQKTALAEMYQDHAVYLARMIKTAAKSTSQLNSFMSQIDTFQTQATCHEIAINNELHCNIETHQNQKGHERQYTNKAQEIAKARNVRPVGRDLRVKIIYEIIQQMWEENQFADLEKFDDDLEERPLVICPFCQKIIADSYKVVDGIHEDGSDEWHWDYTWDFCDHYAARDPESDSYDFQDSEINSNLYDFLQFVEDHYDFCNDHPIFEEFAHITYIQDFLNCDFEYEQKMLDDDAFYFLSDDEMNKLIELSENLAEIVKFFEEFVEFNY